MRHSKIKLVLEVFLGYVQTTFPGEALSQEHAQHYLLKRVDSGKSWSTINVDYSSLRKYYKVMLDYAWNLKKLPRPKRDKVLPAILSKEEVGLLIQSAPTLKHQVFLTFLYATGVRLSEATHVKLEDIDSNRMQIRIHRGKGAKDRTVVLNGKLYQFCYNYSHIFMFKSLISSLKILTIATAMIAICNLNLDFSTMNLKRTIKTEMVLLELLRMYYKIYRPSEYLFNGKKKGSAYSTSAGQWSIRRARKLAGITKTCSIHTLRNCYATHHLELGTDLVYRYQLRFRLSAIF